MGHVLSCPTHWAISYEIIVTKEDYAEKDSYMCKFCDIIRSRIKKDILFEDSCVVVFLSRPHHLGHTQVVLREHQEDITALPEEMVHTFVDDMLAVARVLQKVLKPDKLNYELFGNWVPHLHWHILPRFKTDSDFGNPPGEPLRNQPYTQRPLRKKQLQEIKDELKNIERCGIFNEKS